MESIESAILRTVLYADVFNFALTPKEIHHFLVHETPISQDEFQHVLRHSLLLKERLEVEQGYVVYTGRRELVPLRIEREHASQRLWPLAIRYGTWLARLPFVRMVAMTGALAVRNCPDHDDDLDYLLVTVPGRVWLARAFAILLVRLGRLRGVEICPNYILAENALEQTRQDLFMAHEITQMVPLHGHAIYAQIRTANCWVENFLPNAEGVFYDEKAHSIGCGWQSLKSALECLLGGWIGDKLESWEYRRKLRRFEADMRTPYSAAQLDSSQVKGHFNDHGHPVLRQYAERLREYGLQHEAPISAPGN